MPEILPEHEAFWSVYQLCELAFDQGGMSAPKVSYVEMESVLRIFGVPEDEWPDFCQLVVSVFLSRMAKRSEIEDGSGT